MSSSSKVIIEDSALEILRGAVFSGTKYIDNINEVTVAGFANAEVSKADTIISENIKKDTSVLGVVGSYDGQSTGIRFNTVAFTYDEAYRYLEEHDYHISLSYYPFFKITNISKGLEENQYYAITQAEYDFPIGYVDDKNEFYRVYTDEMVLNYYSEDRSGAEKIDYLYNYWDDLNIEYYLTNINLYIVEKVGETEQHPIYKVIDKGSSKLNALYPLDLSVYDGNCEHIQLLDTQDQIIATYDRISEEGFHIEDTLYNNEYRMKVITVVEDICWGIYDIDSGYPRSQVDYQYPKIFKPEEVDCQIFIADKKDIRILAKYGLPFFCCSYYKMTESSVIDGETLSLTTYAQIESGKIVFEIHNSFTSETHVIDAEYEDKEYEKYWFVDIKHDETEEILEGDNDTVITITCKNVPFKTSTYIHDDSSQVDFILTENGNEIQSGSILEEGDEYQIKAIDGRLPKYGVIYINGNLYRKLDYETEFVYLDLTDEYISDNDETTIRVDIEPPAYTTIKLGNESSRALDVQKQFSMGDVNYWMTVDGGSCNPNSSINVQVEATEENVYRIKTNADSINAILNNGSKYHGEVKQESSMDLAGLGPMTYVLVNDDLPISEDGFYLNQGDVLSFSIGDKQKDFITIDNTNGTSNVNIRGYWGGMSYTDDTVMPGFTYNLTSQTYMMEDVTEFSIHSVDNATWLAEGAEEPVALSKDNDSILDPDGNNRWTVTKSYAGEHIGTITLGGGEPPTENYISYMPEGANTIELGLDDSYTKLSGGESISLNSIPSKNTFNIVCNEIPEDKVIYFSGFYYNGKDIIEYVNKLMDFEIVKDAKFLCAPGKEINWSKTNFKSDASFSLGDAPLEWTRRVGVSGNSDSSQKLFLVFEDTQIYAEGIPTEFEWDHDEDNKLIGIEIKPNQTIDLVLLAQDLFGSEDNIPRFTIELKTSDPENFKIFGTGDVVIPSPSPSYSKTYDNDQLATKRLSWDIEGGKNRYITDTGLYSVNKSTRGSNDVLDMVFNLQVK